MVSVLQYEMHKLISNKEYLEPLHVVGGLEHVVTVPARKRHERDRIRVVTDFLQIRRHFLLDLVVAGLNSCTNINYKSEI